MKTVQERGREMSDGMMLAREEAYVQQLRGRVPDLREDVLEAMRALYRAGWRDCRELMG